MRLTHKIDIASKVLAANLFKSRSPLSVYLHITDRCPLRCKYCEIPKHPREELSTKEVLNLIEHIHKTGANRLHLNGGEPLMREDIGEIIDYAKRRNLYVSMSSNGYLLSEKISQLRNLDIIFLSFDGRREAHDSQRGEGSYQKVIEAFGLCKRYRIKFWTTTVLTRNNLNSIDFILEEAKRHWFVANFQILYYPFGCHFKTSTSSHPLQSLLLTKEEYRKIFRRLIQEKKRHNLIANSQEFLKYLLAWDNYEAIYSTEVKNGVRCWAAKLFCVVDIDGAVYPCYDCIGKTDALNFLDVGFQRAFYSLKEGCCKSCILSCYLEMNLMFSLNLKAIFNYLKLV